MPPAPSSSRPIQVPSALPSPVLGGAGATVGLNVGAGEAVGIDVGAAEVVGVGVGFIASHTAVYMVFSVTVALRVGCHPMKR